MLCVVFQVFKDTSWSPLACSPIYKSNNLINKYMDGQILASSLITVCFADKYYRKISYSNGLLMFWPSLFTVFPLNLLMHALIHTFTSIFFSIHFFICNMSHSDQLLNRTDVVFQMSSVCAAQKNISRKKELTLIALNTGDSFS